MLNGKRINFQYSFNNFGRDLLCCVVAQSRAKYMELQFLKLTIIVTRGQRSDVIVVKCVLDLIYFVVGVVAVVLVVVSSALCYYTAELLS